MPLAPDLSGRIALGTGGSRGIGAAIACLLAEAGADVAVNYRERRADAEVVTASIAQTGRRAVAVPADVSRGEAVAAMMRSVTDSLGAPDILVNNAGIALIRGIDDLTEADFDQTIATNLKSAFLCTQAVLPHMRAALGSDHQYFLRRCPGRRRRRPALQRLQGRAGGADPRLCRAPGERRHHRQCRRAVAD